MNDGWVGQVGRGKFGIMEVVNSNLFWWGGEGYGERGKQGYKWYGLSIPLFTY